MKTAGIICEYNPLHSGHVCHIEATRRMTGGETAIVCVMSGNFVQRGDFAVFSKHARAKAAVLCGADLVIELPSPYALSSAERFAAAGVHILDSLRICDYISFGSESGDIEALREAAEAIISEQAGSITKQWLDKGASYASALQKAADAVLGARSALFLSPNNLLGIEYLKAAAASGSSLIPITVRRLGAAHDSGYGCSASAIRAGLTGAQADRGVCTANDNGGTGEQSPYDLIPHAAAEVFKEEARNGRGPVTMKDCELAMLSRLRAVDGFPLLPDASEGLDHRLARYTASEATIEAILGKVKTKRYAMSRIRRMLMCACLGITGDYTREPPPYIRVLAMNGNGKRLLREARGKTNTPIVTKPASALKLHGRAEELFKKEAAATDFYSLAYHSESNRAGGQEWRTSPVIIEDKG